MQQALGTILIRILKLLLTSYSFLRSSEFAQNNNREFNQQKGVVLKKSEASSAEVEIPSSLFGSLISQIIPLTHGTNIFSSDTISKTLLS